jgi:cytochrome c553
MEPFAKMVRQLGVDDVAAYFAAQPREKLALEIDREAAARGRTATGPCAACHGEDGYGDERRGIPSLRGQPPGYLRNQLLLFRADRRSPGEPALVNMKSLLKSIDDATLADLAAHYASLGR